MDSFLFEFLKNEKNKENFIQLSSGSTQKFISLEFMRKFQTIMAPTYITEQFHDTYTPLYSEISNLIDQNQLLKEARDILLPRLMTGMIDTDDMDIAI